LGYAARRTGLGYAAGRTGLGYAARRTGLGYAARRADLAMRPAARAWSSGGALDFLRFLRFSARAIVTL
jgi:hypothetical protein